MVSEGPDIISTSLTLGTNEWHSRAHHGLCRRRHAEARWQGYPLEIGGHLIGRKIIDQASGLPMTYVDRAMEADADSTHSHVSFRATNALRVHETCEELTIQVVGYYHSHPGFGVFQSGEDVRNFSLYYPYDHQVAVVIDPTKVKRAITIASNWLGFFGWNSQMKPYLLDDSCVWLLVEPLDMADNTGSTAIEQIDSIDMAAEDAPVADRENSSPAGATQFTEIDITEALPDLPDAGDDQPGPSRPRRLLNRFRGKP